MRIADEWDPEAPVTLYHGDTLDLLGGMPSGAASP